MSFREHGLGRRTEPALHGIREQVAELESCLRDVKSELWPEVDNAPAGTTLQINEQVVRRLLKARRLREQLLGGALFADPAWDILLEAFAAELGQKRTCVSDLCVGSQVPATTALRWIKHLEGDGWLIRLPDPLDARRCWVQLTPEGSKRLRHYFGAIWPNLLAV